MSQMNNKEIKAETEVQQSYTDGGYCADCRSQFKPILFSTIMVKAILDGNKTQTRRIVKEPFQSWMKTANNPDWFKGIKSQSKFGQIGNFLWVRETFTIIDWWEDSKAVQIMYEDAQTKVVTLTDNEWVKFDKWAEKSERKPSLFMFKSLSRIHLEIIDIKAERLQNISESDAHNEGVDAAPGWGLCQARFKDLWKNINGNWGENPFVWAITFKVVECPQGFC